MLARYTCVVAGLVVEFCGTPCTGAVAEVTIVKPFLTVKLSTVALVAVKLVVATLAAVSLPLASIVVVPVTTFCALVVTNETPLSFNVCVVEFVPPCKTRAPSVPLPLIRPVVILVAISFRIAASAASRAVFSAVT